MVASKKTSVGTVARIVGILAGCPIPASYREGVLDPHVIILISKGTVLLEPDFIGSTREA